MIRNIVIALGIVAGAIVAIQLIHTSDLERVEDEMERLFEVAQEGGEDAVLEILDAFADDYRGSGPFKMASIERNLRYALVPAGSGREIRHGDFQPIAKGGEIVVPIVSISANLGGRGELQGNPVRVVVSVTWAQREGRWKIVTVTRWRSGG